jgi:methylenetetrahydrofolate--tRNA-(uracil-5-)-methyltransferase
MKKEPVHIIGGGLAGSEACWQIAELGVPVILHEMRPTKKTPAHQTENLAELVCSNSFRSDDAKYNAVGLLHEEMRRCNSLIIREGDNAALPAGGALAVDRDIFSENVSKALLEHPNIQIKREEVQDIPYNDWDNIIISTGPLTSSALANSILKLSGENELAFFDAIAPIIYKDTIDFDIAWFQSRYDKKGPKGSGKDYINCPLNKEQYETFIQNLLDAEYGVFKDWEKDTPYFEGCMPIEVMAARGIETLRFGPMKPVGLIDPNTNEQPYAVVQLRQDNALGSLYNMVGFQTKMKYGAQTEIFRTIPGLENAKFARLGGLHRNTFINSPKLLDKELRMKKYPNIRFAGQITGCEGYVESAAVGIIAGRYAAYQYLQTNMEAPPQTTAIGSLLNHITGGAMSDTFQPMNINFGLFPPLEEEDAFTEYINKKGKTKRKKLRGKDKKEVVSSRALKDLEIWLNTVTSLAA